MKIKITAMKQVRHSDLIEKYENPIEHECDITVGDVFISENARMPENFCQSAWESLAPYVKELNAGGGNFFDGWMKNPKSAMLSCSDGFRPVSFLVEVME